MAKRELTGWIARNRDINELIFYPGEDAPIRMESYWLCGFTWSYCVIPDIFPEITWESDPQRVKLTIEIE